MSGTDSAGRFNILSQMEHLQSKSTFASLMGHTDLTNHLAICENESKARVRFQMLEKMLQPCGPPPEKKSED